MTRIYIEDVDWDELRDMVNNLSDDEVITIDFSKKEGE